MASFKKDPVVSTVNARNPQSRAPGEQTTSRRPSQFDEVIKCGAGQESTELGRNRHVTSIHAQRVEKNTLNSQKLLMILVFSQGEREESCEPRANESNVFRSYKYLSGCGTGIWVQDSALATLRGEKANFFRSSRNIEITASASTH